MGDYPSQHTRLRESLGDIQSSTLKSDLVSLKSCHIPDLQDLVQIVTNDFKTELREENHWLLFAPIPVVKDMC